MLTIPTSEELAMQSADQIFNEGLWQELDRPETDSNLTCYDPSTYRSLGLNEVTFE